MSNTISLYPLLNSESKEPLFKNVEINFFYQENNEIKFLNVDNNNELKDPNEVWDKEEDNLNIKLNLEFSEKISELYYDEKRENTRAIARNDAEIGLALCWSSPSSHIKDSIPICSIPHKSGETNTKIEYDYPFPQSVIKGTINIALKLYIREKGKVFLKRNDPESIFANTTGSIIGEVFNTNIIIDNGQTIFPIYEVKVGKNKPLWNVKYDLEDPSTDPLDETVSIYLNVDHRNYSLIDRRSETFSNQLFIEIMTGALTYIIETVRMHDEKFSCIENAEQGSVGMALLYFKDRFNWNFSNSISTFESIHSYFESKIDQI